MSSDAPSQSLTVHFAAETTASGVSRATWQLIADRLGMSETDAIQLAMVQLASKMEKEMQHPGLPSAEELNGWDFSGLSRAVAKAVPELVRDQT